jgi:hypothetical protein
VGDEPGMRQVGQRDGEGTIGPDLRVAVRTHHAQRYLGRRAYERGEQVQGIGTSPLQIVEDQECAGRPCHVGQEAGHGPEYQAAFLLRRQRRGRHRPVVHPLQLRQQTHQPPAFPQVYARLRR